ncbi:hypothetical protein C9374_000949 [Naegleria lovaniensis]|uniref:Uncharacterized protein n=1 Tax=Naegleria lovaniensis TaxID=51637 RepID=A0AA88GYN3_NAELO|nr:uncharacterized protein C9374_000949 [Naegleria lovaniensis]KAG2388099.1 hypothetical protein C9374_000949 [Naegleria lovaniensis]
MKSDEKTRIASLMDEEAQKRKKALDQQRDEFDVRLASTNEIIARLNKELEALRQTEATLNGKVSNLSRDIQEKEDTSQRLSKAKQHLESQLESLNSTILSLKLDLNKKDEDIKSWEQEVEELKKLLKDAKDSHGMSQSALITQVEELEKQLKIKQTESKSLEQQLNSLRQSLTQNALSIDEKDKLITSLHSQLNDKEKIISDLKKKEHVLMHDIENMKIEHKNEKSFMEKKFSEEIDKLKRSYEDKIQQINKEQEESMTSMNKSSSQQLQELKQKLMVEFDAERKQLQSVIEQKKKEFEELSAKSKQELNQIQKQIEELAVSSQNNYKQLKKDMTDIIDQRDVEIATLKSQIQQMSRDSNTSLEELHSKLQEAGKREAQLNQKIELMTQKVLDEKLRVESLQKEIKDLENRLALTIEKGKEELRIAASNKVKELSELKFNMENQFDKRLSDELRNLRAELTDLFNGEKQRLIKELQENGQSERDSVEKTWQAKVDLLQKEISSLQKKISDLEAEILRKTEDIQLMLSNHNNSMEKSELDKIESLKSLERQKEMEKQALIESYEATITDLYREIKNKENEIQQKLDAIRQCNNQIQEGIGREQDLGRQMDKLKEEHKQNIQHLEGKHQQELDKAKQRELQSIENLTKENKLKMDELIKSHTEKLYELEETLKNKFLAERAQYLDKLDKKEAEFDDYVRKSLKDFNDMQNQMTEESKKRERQLIDEYKRKINDIIEENIKETQSLQLEFSRSQTLMEERSANLEQKIREWEFKYQNRESRPEDIETIKVLQQGLAEKEALLQKTIRDMKYYKMELVNKEEIYNKTFGRQPNIGVINPLGAKQTPSNMQPTTTQKKPTQTTSKLPPLDKGNIENSAPPATGLLFRSNSTYKK